MCFVVSVFLSQNIEFHVLAISGADGIACGAITDDNADANHSYKGHICIQGYFIDDDGFGAHSVVPLCSRSRYYRNYKMQ